jgi:hypothetical protein
MTVKMSTSNVELTSTLYDIDSVGILLIQCDKRKRPSIIAYLQVDFSSNTEKYEID